MDKIKKVLEKLKKGERETLEETLIRIKDGNFDNLDIKKLKGRENIYRVRKGNLRVIFYKERETINVIALERRSSHTYQ